MSTLVRPIVQLARDDVHVVFDVLSAAAAAVDAVQPMDPIYSTVPYPISQVPQLDNLICFHYYYYYY